MATKPAGYKGVKPKKTKPTAFYYDPKRVKVRKIQDDLYELEITNNK